MPFRKHLCAQCPHYSECPLKTRILVNYCGSREAALHEKITAAFAECRSRRRIVLNDSMVKKPLTPVALPVHPGINFSPGLS